MCVNLAFFSNDKFLVLQVLFKHQIQVAEDVYVPLSQLEVANIVGFSKPKTNQIMQELTAEGYILPHKGLRGKYKLTEAALHVVEVFQSNNNPT